MAQAVTGSIALEQLKDDLTVLANSLRELHGTLISQMNALGDSWQDSQYQQFVDGYKPKIEKCAEIANRYDYGCKNFLAPQIDNVRAIEHTDLGGGSGSVGGGAFSGFGGTAGVAGVAGVAGLGAAGIARGGSGRAGGFNMGTGGVSTSVPPAQNQDEARAQWEQKHQMSLDTDNWYIDQNGEAQRKPSTPNPVDGRRVVPRPKPNPKPVSGPEPVPQPQPEPISQPEPQPQPQPKPGPEPVPQPQPQPEPQPQPQPKPGPEPVPQPQPEPISQPEPQPQPQPKPGPEPVPQPQPQPEPQPQPQPKPGPEPVPQPQPQPEPQPQPQPIIGSVDNTNTNQSDQNTTINTGVTLNPVSDIDVASSPVSTAGVDNTNNVNGTVTQTANPTINVVVENNIPPINGGMYTCPPQPGPHQPGFPPQPQPGFPPQPQPGFPQPPQPPFDNGFHHHHHHHHHPHPPMGGPGGGFYPSPDQPPITPSPLGPVLGVNGVTGGSVTHNPSGIDDIPFTPFPEPTNPDIDVTGALTDDSSGINDIPITPFPETGNTRKVVPRIVSQPDPDPQPVTSPRRSILGGKPVGARVSGILNNGHQDGISPRKKIIDADNPGVHNRAIDANDIASSKRKSNKGHRKDRFGI